MLVLLARVRVSHIRFREIYLVLGEQPHANTSAPVEFPTKSPFSVPSLGGEAYRTRSVCLSAFQQAQGTYPLDPLLLADR